MGFPAYWVSTREEVNSLIEELRNEKDNDVV
jgi:hypothetical protein